MHHLVFFWWKTYIREKQKNKFKLLKKFKQILRYTGRCIGYRGIRFNVIEMFNKYKEENTPSQAKLVVEPGTWRGKDNPPQPDRQGQSLSSSLVQSRHQHSSRAYTDGIFLTVWQVHLLFIQVNVLKNKLHDIETMHTIYMCNDINDRFTYMYS